MGRLDSAFEYLGLIFLSAMAGIVSWQVFSRYVLNSTPSWSEEVTLLLMVWVGFIGIAIGFRERLHISIEFVVTRFPETLQRWVGRGTWALTLLFGLYLVVQGWEFTVLTFRSTLPATQLPSSVLYAIMPVSGAMICVYAVLNLIGFDTGKHDDAAGRDPAHSPESRTEGVD